MRLNEVRERYLRFMESKGHKIVPSVSIIPENDPTTLFTGSGMQPMVPYLLGDKHPAGSRVADSQKCFRAEDIDEVGDNRHTTFFEMLGNWSFGDYFKKEQIEWMYEFLTTELKLDPNNLYITAFIGDEANNLPKDAESVEIWKELFKKSGIEAKDVEIGSEENGAKIGMQGARIFYYDSTKNWWSRSGTPDKMPLGEPGGPDTEMFYEFTQITHDKSFGENCHPNCDCGRFLEIGNNVFMEYQKTESGFKQLPLKNVDFGGGLERLSAATLDNPDIFMVDVLKNMILDIELRSGKKYADNQKEFRVIVDHVRAATFMIADGVAPSNTEEGYVLRRLLRRVTRFCDKLGLDNNFVVSLIPSLVSSYADTYESLDTKRNEIVNTIIAEEDKFRQTLDKGLREFEKGERDPFILFTTYGFPLEMTLELAQEHGETVDIEDFKEKFNKHRETSRAGSEKKFKGGLADHSLMSVKYHTATHLLHKALKEVLGDHVEQKGSNITPERLRFDFSHDFKMTDEEKKSVEDLVNQKISESLPVSYKDIPLEEAQKLGAIGLFEEKYGDNVRVYQIGEGDGRFSLEFCGGPHVGNTSELGHFKIKKEEASSAGVRRIKAILE